ALRGKSDRQPAADKAANSQTDHKSGNHHCHGFGVDAINCEECALPHDLVNQRGHSRAEEEQSKKDGVLLLPCAVEEKRHAQEEGSVKPQQSNDGYQIHAFPSGPRMVVSPRSWLTFSG